MTAETLDPAELTEKQNAIVRRRATDATWAVLWAIGSAELMFGSFAIGSSLGPTPLAPIEVLLGSTVFFIGGAIVSFWLARKRQERGARFSVRVREGRKEHRVVVFDDHLMIGGELVMRMVIASIEFDERGLVLRYRDPCFEGMVLRELTGERRALDELNAAVAGSSGLERRGGRTPA